jgi:hypothetical protein
MTTGSFVEVRVVDASSTYTKDPHFFDPKNLVHPQKIRCGGKATPIINRQSIPRAAKMQPVNLT